MSLATNASSAAHAKRTARLKRFPKATPSTLLTRTSASIAAPARVCARPARSRASSSAIAQAKGPRFPRPLFFGSSCIVVGGVLNGISRMARNIREAICASGAEPRKPTAAGSRLRRPVRGRGGGMVNKFPARRQVLVAAPAGHSPPQLDTKARRSGGTRKDRCAVCTKRPMALRATTKAGYAGCRLRYDKARRDAAPPKAETPRWGEPHRADRASARLRYGTGARKDDNGPTDAAPETFVLGRRPISCPAKRGFVSTGSGGDAAHSKGMGWRRPCSHGLAQSLSREAANGGPPRRWLSWSRVAPVDMMDSRHNHPQFCTKPLFLV